MTASAWAILKNSGSEFESVSEVVISGTETGKTVSLGTFYLLRSAGENDQAFLTATTATRSAFGGSVADGSEVVEERWLQASLDNVAFTPIGGGLGDGAVEIDYSEMATEDLGTLGMAVPVYLRVVFPSTPSTFGDVVFALDLLYN